MPLRGAGSLCYAISQPSFALPMQRAAVTGLPVLRLGEGRLAAAVPCAASVCRCHIMLCRCIVWSRNAMPEPCLASLCAAMLCRCRTFPCFPMPSHCAALQLNADALRSQTMPGLCYAVPCPARALRCVATSRCAGASQWIAMQTLPEPFSDLPCPASAVPSEPMPLPCSGPPVRALPVLGSAMQSAGEQCRCGHSGALHSHCAAMACRTLLARAIAPLSAATLSMPQLCRAVPTCALPLRRIYALSMPWRRRACLTNACAVLRRALQCLALAVLASVSRASASAGPF